ncbi:MAG: hypothetical protein QNJ63_15275 [Calothrix sp. MO_192.B10]|nr:hypothetical protein [Calothrix sp. MO_192.B10]
MLEKLLLAVTITFSLNLLLQMQEPNPSNRGNYDGENQNSPALLVWEKLNKS